MTVMAGGQNFYGTPTEAVALGQEVVGLAEKSGNPGWRNLAQYNLGQAYFLAGRYREAEQMLAQGGANLMGPDASAPFGTPPKYTLLLCCMMKSFTHTVMGELTPLASSSNKPLRSRRRRAAPTTASPPPIAAAG